MATDLLDTTWSGDYESADIENDTGWIIYKHPQHGACLINLNLDEDGIDNSIPLLDLFQNPVCPVVLLNTNGKIDLKYFPSIVLGKTYTANTTQEMLSLIDPETGNPPVLQSICITGNRQEAVSYILTGTDPTNIRNWIELRAKNILWSDIKENPIQFPLTQEDWETIFAHEHKGKYAELDPNTRKLSSSVITKITLGARLKANSTGEMLSLNAAPGDICTRLDFNPRRSYILFGDPSNPDNWIYLEPPESGVDSVNGQVGHVVLDASDIGAATDDHVHEPPLTVKEVNGNKVKFKYESSSEEFGLYVNNSLVAGLKFGCVQKQDGSFLSTNTLSTIDHNHDEKYSDIAHTHDTIIAVDGLNNFKFKWDGENILLSVNGTDFRPFA